MKKVKVIVLTIVFCIASLGVSGTLHYCAGQIQAISMELNKHKGCGACSTGLTDDQSCCSEQTTLFQYDDFQFQKDSFTIQYIPSFVVIIPYFIPLDDSSDYASTTKTYHHSNQAFLNGGIDAQSRLCVFTI